MHLKVLKKVKNSCNQKKWTYTFKKVPALRKGFEKYFFVNFFFLEDVLRNSRGMERHLMNIDHYCTTDFQWHFASTKTHDFFVQMIHPKVMTKIHYCTIFYENRPILRYFLQHIGWLRLFLTFSLSFLFLLLLSNNDLSPWKCK